MPYELTIFTNVCVCVLKENKQLDGLGWIRHTENGAFSRDLFTFTGRQNRVRMFCIRADAIWCVASRALQCLRHGPGDN